MALFKKHTPGTRLTPDVGQLLSEFNHSLMLIADKPLLITNLVAKMKQIGGVANVSVFLLDEGTGKLKLQHGQHAQEPDVFFTTRDRLIRWLEVNEKYLAVSSHPDILAFFPEEEQTKIKQLQAELIYPLKVMNRLSGTVFLGKKTDGTPFTLRETELLSLLVNQAAFAVEHASLYEIQSDRIKRMYRTDRLATLGELAAGAAHEIRNPLTAIRSTIQYLSKDFVADPVKNEMVTELIAEVERINKIVQGLLSFARPSALDYAAVDIEQLINQTLVLVTSSIHKHGIDVQFEYFTGETTVTADREQLKQVFLNLILNATEAMAGNEEGKPRTLIISIERGAEIDSHTRYLLVSFEDTGKGIREEDIDNVFNPFFTTKEEGTGLGLAISYGIVNRHEGEIEVKSIPGKGACFVVKLPQRAL
ncbi:MAG: GAF domain-containing protein [Parabacteroides sp.]|nr:GAF domain-containing protein [Parabacteroides sp.]